MLQRIWRPTLVAGVVIALSLLVAGTNPRQERQPFQAAYGPDMTVKQFAKANGLNAVMLRQVIPRRAAGGMDSTFREIAISPAEEQHLLRKTAVLVGEHRGKDWRRIALKFTLWGTVLAAAGIMLRSGRMSGGRRLLFYGTSTLLFGVLLGAEPNPMGTVKDTVFLLIQEGVIFPPRLLALLAFLAVTVIATRFICSWGCQLGTLQALIYRLAHPRGTAPGDGMPARLPAAVRAALGGVAVGAALLWGTDLFGAVDPFRVFNPATLGFSGGLILIMLLGISTVVYRPWCRFCCPFGLTAQIPARFALLRIHRNPAACTECANCARACPTGAMTDILADAPRVRDCFACGSCLEACPTGSVRFGHRHPSLP